MSYSDEQIKQILHSVKLSNKKVIDDKEETRIIVYLTLRAVGENATDCKIDGVMKYIEENL